MRPQQTWSISAAVHLQGQRHVSFGQLHLPPTTSSLPARGSGALTLLACEGGAAQPLWPAGAALRTPVICAGCRCVADGSRLARRPSLSDIWSWLPTWATTACPLQNSAPEVVGTGSAHGAHCGGAYHALLLGAAAMGLLQLGEQALHQGVPVLELDELEGHLAPDADDDGVGQQARVLHLLNAHHLWHEKVQQRGEAGI